MAIQQKSKPINKIFENLSKKERQAQGYYLASEIKNEPDLSKVKYIKGNLKIKEFEQLRLDNLMTISGNIIINYGANIDANKLHTIDGNIDINTSQIELNGLKKINGKLTLSKWGRFERFIAKNLQIIDSIKAEGGIIELNNLTEVNSVSLRNFKGKNNSKFEANKIESIGSLKVEDSSAYKIEMNNLKNIDRNLIIEDAELQLDNLQKITGINIKDYKKHQNDNLQIINGSLIIGNNQYIIKTDSQLKELYNETIMNALRESKLQTNDLQYFELCSFILDNLWGAGEMNGFEFMCKKCTEFNYQRDNGIYDESKRNVLDTFMLKDFVKTPIYDLTVELKKHCPEQYESFEKNNYYEGDFLTELQLTIEDLHTYFEKSCGINIDKNKYNIPKNSSSHNMKINRNKEIVVLKKQVNHPHI